MPSAAQIEALESRLPAVFKENLKARAGDPMFGANYPERSLSAYSRQYAGLVIHGHRIIYLNAFIARFTSNPRWRDEPVIICDGGTVTFGVEYDPVTKTFANFAFNGAI